MLDNEYLLDMRIKNNVLYQRIMSECNSIREFAKKYNVRSDTLCKLLNFKQPIYDNREWLKGKIVPVVSDLLKKLNCELHDIIPEDYEVKDTNHFFKEIDAITMSQLSYDDQQSLLTDYTLEDIGIKESLKRDMSQALSYLTPREERAIRDYYFFGKTYREIALELGTTHQRAKQIADKGLYKLRLPQRNRKLLQYTTDPEKAKAYAKEEIYKYNDAIHNRYDYFEDSLTGKRISKNCLEKVFKEFYPTDISFDLFYKQVTTFKIEKRKFAAYCLYHDICYSTRDNKNTPKYKKLEKDIESGKIKFKD